MMMDLVRWIPWVLAALILLGVVLCYNGLVAAQNAYGNAFAQIDVQLRRRHDLIPNLVNVCKAYLTHERETLEAVIAARQGAQAATKNAAAGASNSMQQVAQAEGALSTSLVRLMAVAERYPDLKAQLSTSQLTEELTSTENRIGYARQAFNDAVTDYNTSRQSFPAVLLAKLFGFAKATLLQSIEDQAQRDVPVVAL
jgi:LemA protein